MNLSIVILPAKVLANGKHKIRIAMSHRGETRYFVTRHVVPSVKNLKNGQVVGKEIGNANYINMQLSQEIQRIYKAYDELKDVECYSCAQLLELIKNQMHRSTLKSFGAVSVEWLEIKEKQNKPQSITLYKLAIDLFAEYAGKDFLLELLNLKYVYSYEEWLIRKGLSNTTINMRMRVLRAIVRFAVTRRYIVYDNNPFLGYQERPETARDVALTHQQLRRLVDLQPEDEHVALCRDVLLMSFYLAGMNIADVFALNFSVKHLSFIRTKTNTRRRDGNKTEFDIQPEARAIIDKYINKDGRVTFNGKTTAGTMNSYFFRHLKKLAEAIQAEHLIYYSMRKTFAQIANELGIQERVIAYCIGDKYNERNSGSVGYYIKTTPEMANDAIRKVFDFVAQIPKEKQPD